MFKVPDWGNDIPKSNIEVSKIFTNKCNKKKIKNNVSPKAKENISKLKKSKSTYNRYASINGNTKFSKKGHIDYRIARATQKANKRTSLEANNNHPESPNGSSQEYKNHVATDHINHEIKNKILKAHNKRKSNIGRKSENSYKANKVLPGNTDNNIDNVKKRKPQKRKHTQNIGTIENKKFKKDIQSVITGDPDKVLGNAKRNKLNDKIINHNMEDFLLRNKDSYITKKKKKIKNKQTKSEELTIDEIKNNDIEDVLFSNKDNIIGKKNKTIKTKQIVKSDNGDPSSKITIDKSEQVVSRKEKKIQQKKEKLKILLKEGNRSFIRSSGNTLREKMLERIKAAQFRYLNEKLYTSSGSESQELFKKDPIAFQTYHDGYRQQVKKWPINPLDLIVKRIQKMPKTYSIADMGCGEAALSKQIPHSIRSFDLMQYGPGVEVCNMAHTPLLTASMDVVVYCLALMGTDLTQYLLEANRVLKIGGHLLIAEVESRFEKPESFCSDVQRLGFSLKNLDKTHKMFFFMEFTKVRDAPSKKHKLPVLSLKPCLYKKR